MRTKDGQNVDWPYSDASITKLTKDELLALVKGSAASKAVALSKLSRGDVTALFGVQDSNRPTIVQQRRIMGRRILEYDVYRYCEDMGETRLRRTLQRAAKEKWDRETLKRELMRWA